MTAALELFLRGVGRFRHRHTFETFDFTTLSWRCRCGESRLQFTLDARRPWR